MDKNQDNQTLCHPRTSNCYIEQLSAISLKMEALKMPRNTCIKPNKDLKKKKRICNLFRHTFGNFQKKKNIIDI